MNSTMMTRQGFIAGGALAFGAAAAGLSSTARPSWADEASPDRFAGYLASDYADSVTSTVDVDICVVGAGMSGLAAALESAQQGVRVALLESQEAAGGNGNMSDCMMSFGSPQMLAGAEAEGVEVTAGQIIRGEVELFNYNCDGTVWTNILAHSADNTQWLIEAGVLFDERTVYYGGSAETPTALMWRDGVGSGATCAVAPLVEAIAALGVEPMYSTRAKALKTDGDGSVCGVYAETPDGVVEVNAKAVILAGGGWVANTELVQEIGGLDVTRHILFCAPGCLGDTLMMSAAIGAREDAAGRGYMSNAMVSGLNIYGLPKFGAGLWVNELGKRFANEDCSDVVYDYICSAIYNQNQAWIVITDELIDLFDAQNPNPSGGAESLRAATEEALAAGVGTVFKADTLEELAGAMGIDVEGFLATVKAYNGYVAAGYDDQFAKKPENLVAIENGPFYGYANVLMACLSLGGINTNSNWQVIDKGRNPIPGLYAVGADGQMVYKTQYNLKTSGGHMALNIESGRYSVRHALAHCLGIEPSEGQGSEETSRWAFAGLPMMSVDLGVGVIYYTDAFYAAADDSSVNPVTAEPYAAGEVAAIIDGAAAGAEGYVFDVPEGAIIGISSFDGASEGEISWYDADQAALILSHADPLHMDAATGDMLTAEGERVATAM